MEAGMGVAIIVFIPAVIAVVVTMVRERAVP
jgi:hypothetical protein